MRPPVHSYVRQGERERRIGGGHSAHQLFLVLFCFFFLPPRDVILIASGKVAVGHRAHRHRRHPPGRADNERVQRGRQKAGALSHSSPVHSSHSTKQLPSQSSGAPGARPPNNLKERKWVFLEGVERGGGEFTPSRLYLTPPPSGGKKKEEKKPSSSPPSNGHSEYS